MFQVTIVEPTYSGLTKWAKWMVHQVHLGQAPIPPWAHAVAQRDKDQSLKFRGDGGLEMQVFPFWAAGLTNWRGDKVSLAQLIQNPSRPSPFSCAPPLPTATWRSPPGFFPQISPRHCADLDLIYLSTMLVGPRKETLLCFTCAYLGGATRCDVDQTTSTVLYTLPLSDIQGYVDLSLSLSLSL
jgi:hypothetical protein